MEYFNYIEHYFDMASAVPFFLVSLAGLIFVMGVILALARIRQELDRHGASSVAAADEANAVDLDAETRPQSRTRHQYADRIDDRLNGREHWPDTDPATETRPHSRARRPLLDPVDTRPHEFIESFYEMAFASTSILLLLSLYYIIGDRINLHTVSKVWNQYKDWVLIGFLLVSMLVDRIFDRVLVPLRYISAQKRGSVRLMASIYVMLILMYIRFIYEDYNYENLILYFVMLVIGRLVYFDVTWDGFRNDCLGLFRNLPVLLLMSAYSATVVWYGFTSGFLMKANGVIVSTLIAHLFMDICIFLFDRSHFFGLFLR
ncbi:MAG: hypothetical protein SOU53_08575 [Oliverpabstia sp.]|nr:hypothetical protein [Oliverpabstia sp.]